MKYLGTNQWWEIYFDHEGDTLTIEKSENEHCVVDHTLQVTVATGALKILQKFFPTATLS